MSQDSRWFGLLAAALIASWLVVGVQIAVAQGLQALYGGELEGGLGGGGGHWKISRPFGFLVANGDSWWAAMAAFAAIRGQL